MHRINITAISLCMILFAIMPLSATGGKLYRWIGDDGKVHYSDRVPPDQARKERSELDERGIEIDRVEAAKTREQIAREKELKRLRAEQQRLIDQQKAADRVLLRTFRSEDDIKMARDGKLAAIDVHIQVVRSNIKRLKRNLERMQKNAADRERQGKDISKRYLEDMANIRQQIKDAYAAIVQKERSKEQIWAKHEQDLQRFRILKKLKPETPGMSPAQKTASLLETVVVCADPASCDSVWKKAEAYVQKHATTRLQMSSRVIIMTAMPVQDNEYSLTVSRMAQKKGPGAEIFLDIQCKNSPGGEALCKSERIKAIRSGFRAAMGAQ